MSRILTLSAALAWLALSGTAAAEATDPWDHHWSKCRGFKVPIFQFRLPEVKQLFSAGKEWESKVRKELAELDNITRVTCRKWAENPNGHEPLREFTQRFSAASLSALDLQETARSYLTPELGLWRKTEAQELAALGFPLEHFACGQSLRKAETSVQESLRAIEAKFSELRQKCPRAADAVIAKARAEGLRARPAPVGKGGPGRVPSGSQERSQSDITGIKPRAGEASP